jgi:hypothetical protein
MRDYRDVGGTRGGLGMFLGGFALLAVGMYLLLQHVTVYGGYWSFGGGYGRGFGMTLIPLVIGVVILFANGKSWAGWLLTIGSVLAILAGIVANLDIYFRQTSLFNTLVMLGLIAAGMGLVIRSTKTIGGDGTSSSSEQR